MLKCYLNKKLYHFKIKNKIIWGLNRIKNEIIKKNLILILILKIFI